jgi:hypothetical protein
MASEEQRSCARLRNPRLVERSIMRERAAVFLLSIVSGLRYEADATAKHLATPHRGREAKESNYTDPIVSRLRSEGEME